MVGGRGRSRFPRELADDPESWPHADLSGHPAVAVVQAIAAALQAVMAERGLSFRRLADVSGVNRQTVADVAGGRCWPDAVTIAQLEAGLAVRLWPASQAGTGGSRPAPDPFSPW
ncbi:helix-turn-helix domain-containing protein [Nonomuraea diastatica]|uniref:helix-turn-helix domain-containing protein n=1 Tax=Nonomuraea diastatica TaxID=1848329 RepID=UPI0015F2EA2E|nr:helix-turn-helix transcriptional regulator [Nonomuraea diastatica]